MTDLSPLATMEVPWAPKPNRLALHAGEVPTVASANRLVTASFLLAHNSFGVLSVRVLKRGWDVPGGHVEGEETPLEAIVREAREEAGLTVDPGALTPLGYSHLHIDGAVPTDYKYPAPEAYQAFYGLDLSLEAMSGLATEVPEEIGEVSLMAWSAIPANWYNRPWGPLLNRIH